MITSTTFYKTAYSLIKNLEAKKDFSRRFYSIAGSVLCIVFTDERMLPLLTPAFEHLSIPEQFTWDFLIYVADHESVERPLKMLRGYESSIQSRGEISAFSQPHLLTFYNHHDGALNFVNFYEKTAIYWVRSLKHLPWWVAGSPLQRILGCWMRRHQMELTHAGAVGYPDGGVLLAGKSGSGKSTTTLTCVESDFYYVSEDYCLLDNQKQPTVHSVYNSLKLEPSTLNRFPHLESYSVNKARLAHEKALVFQYQIASQKILKSFPLKAILVLSVGEKTELRSCRPVDAALALSASTICQLTAAYRPTLTHYASVLKKIPCYQLILGFEERNSIVKKIESVLSGRTS